MTLRSTAEGTAGLSNLDRDPRRHIREERSKENPREQRSHPITKEYGEFHFSLRREARRLYVTEAALPMPPEEENTSGIKLPCSTPRIHSS